MTSREKLSDGIERLGCSTAHGAGFGHRAFMGITAYRANVEIHIFQLAFNSLLVQVGMDFLNFVDIPHVLGDILFAFGFHTLIISGYIFVNS